MEQETFTAAAWHRKQAVDNFNAAWTLMNKTDRTQEENFRMIHTAHASRFHWGVIGTPLEFSRGEWQIARVYSILGMAESALAHAEYCLRLSELNALRG